jgi:hypothetical protein
MAVEFRQLTINFDPTAGRVQREEATAVFSARVQKAEAMLKGFQIGYNNGDHHILREEIDLDVVQIQNNSVTVAANFLLRDSSGNIDDPFSGFVQCVVVADTAANPQT